MTSSHVKWQTIPRLTVFGTQVILYVQPRGRLAELFGQSVDKGCTRVEIRLPGNMALGLNMQKMHEMIDGVINIGGDAVQHTTHKQSIQALWHENTDHVLICKNNEIFFVDYFNSLTQKITGSCEYRQKHVNIDMVCRHVANKVSKKDIRCGCLKSSAAQWSWAVLQKNMTALWVSIRGKIHFSRLTGQWFQSTSSFRTHSTMSLQCIILHSICDQSTMAQLQERRWNLQHAHHGSACTNHAHHFNGWMRKIVVDICRPATVWKKNKQEHQKKERVVGKIEAWPPNTKQARKTCQNPCLVFWQSQLWRFLLPCPKACSRQPGQFWWNSPPARFETNFCFAAAKKERWQKTIGNDQNSRSNDWCHKRKFYWGCTMETQCQQSDHVQTK